MEGKCVWSFELTGSALCLHQQARSHQKADWPSMGTKRTDIGEALLFDGASNAGRYSILVHLLAIAGLLLSARVHSPATRGPSRPPPWVIKKDKPVNVHIIVHCGL